ncbi:2-octaprenyl-6-methoxyphenyl hydroxylase [Pseudomonas matsuisoli]|uniref:2-octaprenyl-6-methoxyphenyl hydroxylase n=1 Tax=Pseudomonas matsuisoli TaxID=1515666 RepID=A0A917Q0D7_9PSED|nr:2-octaprenyl-6-methoxyphenyl hydroxylase [Pseudomonas matsuisoli]GGK03339.1 2-octaprenyl-6-methoxyphenyl hydroxylase [Pseudomonas matsuisoli]
MPPESSHVDIAIVGGGLVGASLALALQDGARARGWRIALIEPYPPGEGYQPSYDARSSALSFGARQIYQRSGVWHAIERHAQPITHIHVSDRGRAGATRLNAADEGVPALGYVVENAWIGQCLWDALDDDVIHWRRASEVASATAIEGGYSLALRDGSKLNASLVVLADGGRSSLREQLGIHARRTPYDQHALIANVSTREPHRGQAFERFSDEGPMALLPLTDNRSALVWTRLPAEAQRLLVCDEKTFLDELQQAFGYRLGAFTQVGSRYHYPLELIESTEQVRPHLVVLGNAAHSLHPVAGQGFNLSLRDVQALADTLLGGATAPGDFATLQRYHQGQLADQYLTVGFSHQLTRMFAHREAAVVAGRNFGLLGLDLLPPAKSWFARQAMGLGSRIGRGRS